MEGAYIAMVDLAGAWEKNQKDSEEKLQGHKATYRISRFEISDMRELKDWYQLGLASDG